MVAPATFAMPMLMMRLTTGPKNPMRVYPAIGAAARCVQELRQIIAHPAMTGKQQRTSRMRRMFGIRLERYPVMRIKMKQTPPSGN